MNFLIKKLPLIILIISFLLFIYTFYRSEIFWSGENRVYYYKYYLFVILLIIISYLIRFTSDIIKEYFLIISASIIISLYCFELYLSKSKINNSNKFNFSKVKYFNELKKNTKNITMRIHSEYNKDINLLNLAGNSNKLTILCNENGYYAKYLSDRYGFNNLDSMWDEEKIDYTIIGDSFGIGECVNRDENIASNLISNKKKVLNLSYSGHGPLKQFAVLREYWKIDSDYIIWLFYEGNDIGDFNNEKNDLILKKYFDDEKFNQNLIRKQTIIDDYYNEEYIKNLAINKIIYPIENNIINFLKLFETRNFLILNFKNKIILTEEFKLFMNKQNKHINAKNSKLILVYLPEFLRFNSIFKYDDSSRIEIKNLAKEFGIPFIDIYEEVFIKEQNPLTLFPYQQNGHYNAEGYKKISEAIYKYIKSLNH